MFISAEYIWVDGTEPTSDLRSKTRIISIEEFSSDPSKYPTWSFDGSSTNQASGAHSDLYLKPVRVVKDPIRKNNSALILCEVFNPNKTPHKTNTRARLRRILDNGGSQHEALFGFEQEYTLFYKSRPLGWPREGYPPPQGPYYCGVGTHKAYGRDIVEQHLQSCVAAGISVYGINAEVMPGQWEYQIGYRGFAEDNLDALTICDHQLLARWLLCRIAEDHSVIVSFENKPVKGDWNGAGCHTNFSTKKMREPGAGYDCIINFIKKLSTRHNEHIALYGNNLHERLTGLHETCSIDEFKYGVSDRGASIRIPLHVKEKGYGYMEDRRPGANSDPYVVACCLISTAADLSLNELSKDTLEVENIEV